MTDSSRRTDLSKWLSWALRHDPNAAGITLDPSGWTEVDILLKAAVSHGRAMSRDELVEVVATSDKKRFALSDDGSRIRANQGHSVAVDLGLVPKIPPTVLYHGTSDRFLTAILAEGLKRQARQHVHLSADMKTARTVGARHGRPVILAVDAARMHAVGHLFMLSENGVWLTTAVPLEFLSVGG